MVSMVVVLAVFITSAISGVMGMAGGMLLMGVLGLLLPVTGAMLLHGVTQSGANGFRAILHRQFIAGGVLKPYFFGATLSFMLISALSFTPT